jgi:lipopolysaccharide transport system ATP-binding protein
MASPTVEFDGVWKKFRRGERHDSLRDLLPALVRRSLSRPPAIELQESEFWAVRDVSFSVGVGEALGIIGSNGAGKSTILKLLTRILRPTRGRCSVRGRIGALIEIAAGFHPDLTGRENVFLQGAIMGMKQVDIARKFDQIVEFGGVGDFIDTPVKRYSSGMNARLGFAIAAHLDPEVLLIDEVLSVGDASFQDRCVKRMRELVSSGIPLVFISHNLPSIIDLCSRAIVLDRGTVKFDGTPADAVAHYRAASSAPESNEGQEDAAVRLNRVLLLDVQDQPASVFRTDAEMTVRLEFDARDAVEATVHVDFHRTDGVHCAGFNNFMDRLPFGTLSGPGTVDIRIPRLPLLPGCYTASIWILDGHAITVHQKRLFAYPFSVVSEQHGIGMMHVPRRWILRSTDNEMTERATEPAQAR